MNTQLAPSIAPMTGLRRFGALAALCLTVLLAPGCARQVIKPRTFASPDEAVQALASALRANSTENLLAIVGSDGESIVSSGDEVADRQGRQMFVALFDEKHALVDAGADSRTLLIGKSDWPFPVPIVKEGGKWTFDAEAGREELLNRRIGRNELAAIQVCKVIADAQREYALLDLDGDGLHAYAQKFPSDPGKRNGLYWPTAEGEKPSPMGQFVAAASAEGYVRKEEGPTPYHGYCYRILSAQGPSAPGGAMSYVANGKMILGFAVVAWPAEYDNSGIMTFIMGDDGVVYQKDLGEQTAKLATEMKAFDPGEGWKKVE